MAVVDLKIKIKDVTRDRYHALSIISDGIIWLLEAGFGGALHAYDASNLTNELYNSRMNGSRDSLGSFVKFTVPTVANGKVYAGTGNSLAVFGLIKSPGRVQGRLNQTH